MHPRWVVACVALLVVGAFVVLVYVTSGEQGAEGDMIHYVYWTRLVSVDGIQAAYSGTYHETYAIYPPVTLYGLALAGGAYRLWVDPAFDVDQALHSSWLVRAIKLTAVGWHLLCALAIYLLVQRQAGRGLAAWAGMAYALNPAAILDVVYWGQLDGAHSLFSVLALGWLSGGLYMSSGAAMALAVLAKPQAWLILPLYLIGLVRQTDARRLAQTALVGAAAGGVVLLPFLLTGRLGEFLTLPGTVASAMPTVTGNAHNVWWLLLARHGYDPFASDDLARFVGPLTYRATAALLVGAVLLFTCSLYWRHKTGLAETAALGVLGWFLFTTQAHENHLFLVLPLLALAWPTRPLLLVPFMLLTITLFWNIALHDHLLFDLLQMDPDSRPVQVARLGNASINLLVWMIWSLAAEMGIDRGRVRRGLSVAISGSVKSQP
jgi:hypothetical protein